MIIFNLIFVIHNSSCKTSKK